MRHLFTATIASSIGSFRCDTIDFIEEDDGWSGGTRLTKDILYRLLTLTNPERRKEEMDKEEVKETSRTKVDRCVMSHE